MYPATYFVEKTTGTLGDALLAYGVAEFLHQLPPPGSGLDLRLADRGSTYVIQFEGIDSLPGEWFTGLSQPPSLLRYIGTEKTIADCPPHLQPIDYEAHKRRRDAYWQWYNALSKEDKRRAAELAQEQGPDRPDLHLPLWMLINTQKAIKSFNKLVVTWHEHRGCYPNLAHLILTAFSTFPNPIDQVCEDWKTLAQHYGIDADVEETATQIGNPGIAKGGNQSKANKLTEKNLKAFWLIEYLRYVGLFRAAIPIVIRDSGDRKTYVPLPLDMTWSAISVSLDNYRRVMRSNTAVKADILAVLRYLTVHIDNWREAQESGMPWVTAQPGNHVYAISAAFYKDMGSSHAVMDMSHLALPRWMPDPQTVDEASAYIELVGEHTNVIRNLDEKRGNEFAMLRLYRRFLTGGDLRDFLEFCARLGDLAMSLWNDSDARERRRARLFNASTLERIIEMSDELSYHEIFQNEGFQRIAAAIRHATYLPQYFKSKGQGGEFQPEYGLGHKLLQSAVRRDTFLRELGEFVHRYQTETLRRMEHPRFSAHKGQPQRVTLSAEDLADVTYLVDVYGAGSVAALLVATGYTWRSRQTEDEGTPESELTE